MKLFTTILISILFLFPFNIKGETPDYICRNTPYEAFACSEGNVILSNQIALENFVTASMDCDSIKGNLEIKNADIADLSSLSFLRIITGNVILFGNQNLTSLTGLENLESIGGRLQIQDCNNLTNLNALSNLKEINGGLTIFANDQLSDCSGICSLVNEGGITGAITIGGNPSPCSTESEIIFLCDEDCANGNIILANQLEVNAFVASYATCDTIKGNLEIRNADIADLSSLSFLKVITGDVKLLVNQNLTSLNGLENLESIGGRLQILSCNNLTSLTGLENLESIGGRLEISGCKNLTNLNDLSNLKEINSGLTIFNNDQLSDCNGICSLINEGGITGSITIAENPSPCSTESEITFLCDEDCANGNIILANQLEVNAFVASNATCDTIKGNLEIRNADIADLSSLSFLKVITGDVKLLVNQNLTSLNGLENLESIGGRLQILSCNNLTSLNGLENLESIGGRLEISGCKNLTNLNALSNLKEINSGLTIFNNDQLSDCSGICTLINEGGITGSITIAENPSPCSTESEITFLCDDDCANGNIILANQSEVNAFVASYASCDTVKGNLEIRNADIVDLSVLSFLKVITGNVVINSNNSLTSLTGLENLESIGGRLQILNCKNLTNINALANLKEIGNGLTIFNNQQLGDCSILCEIIDKEVINGSISVSGNAATCSKPQGINFEFDIQENQVFLYNTTLQRDIYQSKWFFGDGEETDVTNPSHQYSLPGQYSVCLEVKDCATNNTSEICQEIFIAGINSINPSETSNDNYFIATIVGANFEEGDKVRFVGKTGVEIIPDNIEVKSKTKIDVFTQLQNVPIGPYDVYVEGRISNFVLTNGLTISGTRPGLLISSTIICPPFMVPGRPFHCKVIIENQGNQGLSKVPVEIIIEGDAEAVLLTEIDESGFEQEIKDLEDFFSIAGIELGYFIINYIPPNGTSEIDFQITPKETGPLSVILIPKNPLISPGKRPSSNECLGSACIQCAVDIGGVFPGTVGCAASGLNTLCSIEDLINNEDGAVVSIASVGKSLTSAFLGCVGLTKAGKAAREVLKNMSNYSPRISSSIDVGFNSCPDCLDDFFGSTLVSNVVMSIDPNLKSGTVTESEDNYIFGNQRIYYTIYFENADSATAPASEVLIIDTIDTDVLDISTLQFEGYNFGSNTFDFENPITDSCFTREVDLRPNKNAILRLRGSVEEEIGIVSWKYTTYDPATYALTQDIFEGFLPPNVIKPEGEGFVRFSIMPKPDLPHLTTIENGAAIIFDVNEAILTPVWSNSIDKQKPTSQIIDLSPTQQDTIFELKWEGSDAHSGIDHYDIYVSENSVDFELFLRTKQSSTIFIGELGKTYYFYSMAVDNAGNIEEESTVAIISTQITSNPFEIVQDGFKLYPVQPNPFNQNALIQFELPETAEVILEIYNELGQGQTLLEQRLPAGIHKLNWTPKGKTNGIYFIRMKTSNRSLFRKAILMR